MEYTALFEEQIPVSSLDLKKEIKSFDTIIEDKLCKLLEGKCSRHGFVKRDSVKLLSRSMGALERGRFTGDLIFNVQAEGLVINPPDGFILQGEVIRKNKMGIYVNYMDAVRIILPRDINIGNDEFESVEVGERINVEVKKSRFQVNDEYILSVGLFKGRKNTSNSKGLRAQLFNGEKGEEEAAPEEEEEEEDVEEV
jgi:DNA-directed RNA polymerase subunit E'/Rpb7